MTKNNFYLFIFVCVTVAAILSCTSDDSTGPPEQNDIDYFPGIEGTNYKYKIDQTDSTGTTTTGNRFVSYENLLEIDSVPYRIQIDSLIIDTINSGNISYFRKTSTGVFYYVDTSEVMSMIPDSLKDLVSLQDQLRFLLNPLAPGSFWPVYRVTVNLSSGISFSPVNVSGYFVSQEQITLNLDSVSIDVNTEKVKYDLEIITDINQPVQRLSAYAWLVDKIGIVKMEGNGTLIGAILYGELNLEDSTTTVTQNLVSFEIK